MVNHDVVPTCRQRCRSAVPALIRSWAFPSHTSSTVRPESWPSCEVVGWDIFDHAPNKKLVNSGICPCRHSNLLGCHPSTSVPEKRAITPGSSIGISFRINAWQSLGSHGRTSCPRTSSLRTFSSISWKLRVSDFNHSAFTCLPVAHWTGVRV